MKIIHDFFMINNTLAILKNHMVVYETKQHYAKASVIVMPIAKFFSLCPFPLGLLEFNSNLKILKKILALTS